MFSEIQLTDFLARNNITEEIWSRSNCDWATLLSIGEDHQKNSENLRESAELIAKIIQKIPRVHSVRWRVKDVEHLLAKIVRKKAEGLQKYENINLENYFKLITDLVGVRALHLFKDECIEIDRLIRSTWEPSEKPVVYIRDGDQGELTTQFGTLGFDIKCHPAGYRSIHYVIKSRPISRDVLVEIQVRTIFEEGWSEIDHRVRYPNFSQSELVGYFLSIFNRLSGGADEMGGFVRGLAATLQELESRAALAEYEKKRALADIESTLTEMDTLKQRGQESNEQIARLKVEVERLKRSGGLGLQAPSPSRLLGDSKKPSVDSESHSKLAYSSIDFEKLAKAIEKPVIDFEKYLKLSTPSIDFEKLAKAIEKPAIDLEKYLKLSTPSIDFEKLAKTMEKPATSFEGLTKNPAIIGAEVTEKAAPSASTSPNDSNLKEITEDKPEIVSKPKPEK